MCFSATASFGASIGLLAIGIICLKSARGKKLYPLACIPLIFSFQQALEGFLWLGLSQGGPYLTHLALLLVLTYGYIFFAFVWWPLYIPYALIKAEPNKRKIKVLWVCFTLGMLASWALILKLIHNSVQATINEFHILYDIGISFFEFHLIGILYALATILPFFITSLPGMKLIGWAMGLSLALSYIFYYSAFTSVWCFFAALISILILSVIKRSPVHAKNE